MRRTKLSKKTKGISGQLTIITLLVCTLWLCPHTAFGSMEVLFYDNFDDGDFVGWNVSSPLDNIASAPDVVNSLEGYSLRGVGSGYSEDPGLHTWISQPVSIQTSGELKIEMRAKSGTESPNQSVFYMFSTDNRYAFVDYGEMINSSIDTITYVDGEEVTYSYEANDLDNWHTFAWERDSDGWWSLYMDNQLLDGDWFQDNRLTSFDQVAIHLVRDQSEIEWVKVSGVPVPEPATISLLGLSSLIFFRKRRF